MPVVKPAGIFYVMSNYTTVDGLALDAISCGLRDKWGNLWFGTFGGGVSRYDGKSFTNFSTGAGLADSLILTIFEDSAGNIWFGTKGGLSKYDGLSFTTYTTKEGLVDNSVFSIFEDQRGGLWIGTEGGLNQFDGKYFSTYTTKDGLPDNNVQAIVEDKKGNLWFGTARGGLCQYDGKTFTIYTKEQGLSDNFIRCLLEDKEGDLWIGTYNGGVSKFDGKSFTTYASKEGLSDNYVRCILEDKEGNLWFGTEKGGASAYNGKTFTKVTTREGLSSNKVGTIVTDSTGNLWFGTIGGGVCQFNGFAIANFTQAQGLPKEVMSIAEDKKGNLWFGTAGGGLCRYDGKTFTIYTKEQGLSDNFIRSILEDKEGNLWIGTYNGGVSKFDGKSFTTYTSKEGLADNYVRCILEDKEGNLWFGTDKGGVSRFDGKAFTTYTAKDGLADNSIWSLLEDRAGNLWFSTYGGGVSKFDGTSFINYTTKDGLASNNLMNSFEDREGNLWFGTSGAGVSRFDGSSFLTYTTIQGLPDNQIVQIFSTKEKYIGFGTNKGITFLKGYRNGKQSSILAQNPFKNEVLKDDKPLFEIYNVKRGYPISDSDSGQNSIYLDRKGILWIGTGGDKTGLVRLDYGALNKNNNPLNLFIQTLKVNNQNVAWSVLKGASTSAHVVEEITLFNRPLSAEEREEMQKKFGNIKFEGITKFYNVPENLVLPHAHNSITFDFVAIEPAFPQDVLYQYKLEGYEKDWSSPANETTATFGNIFEGTYQFKVKAQSPFGIWSEPITYTFKVLPPWFRTWWAYSLYALGIISSLYLIFRWRTRVLRLRLEYVQRLYNAAERFVPKQILQLLKREHIEDVELGDSVELPITAMFADIRGFTTLAETLTPQQTALFLNTYMKYMVPVIQENRGFVNLFLGDGILALFPKTPSDSIDAALAMTKMLPKFNKEIEEKGFQPVRVGIGLNTGDAALFALGVKERMEATVVSDAINTASRVEGLNKFYKTQLLISESVYNLLPHPEKYLIRLIDKVFLKGKAVGVRIYEVKPLPEDDSIENERNYYTLFDMAFTFYEKGDFSQAQTSFESCLQIRQDDTVAKILLERCIDFQRSGVPLGWDGTFILTEK